MLKRPPTHRVDAPIVFVHASDAAWDEERIKAEQTEMGDDAKNHPVARYFGGWTRYDLDAAATLPDGRVTTVREYLDDTKQPTMWRLRRLDVGQWYEVHPMVEKAWLAREDPYSAYLKACIYGLERVENGPTLAMPGGRLSAIDLQKLHDLGQANDVDLIYAIGQAVYQASMPLDVLGTEGKR